MYMQNTGKHPGVETHRPTKTGIMHDNPYSRTHKKKAGPEVL